MDSTETPNYSTPILSITDRGARMTQLPTGQPVGHLDRDLVVRALLCGVMWAAASFILNAADLRKEHLC